MIEHPRQHEGECELDEEPAGILQVEVERILFGETGLEKRMGGHGLRWARNVGNGSAT